MINVKVKYQVNRHGFFTFCVLSSLRNQDQEKKNNQILKLAHIFKAR